MKQQGGRGGGNQQTGWLQQMNLEAKGKGKGNNKKDKAAFDNLGGGWPNASRCARFPASWERHMALLKGVKDSDD